MSIIDKSFAKRKKAYLAKPGAKRIREKRFIWIDDQLFRFYAYNKTDLTIFLGPVK